MRNSKSSVNILDIGKTSNSLLEEETVGSEDEMDGKDLFNQRATYNFT